jgi:hypothetical protein
MGTAESNLGAAARSATSSELLSERIAPGILPKVLGWLTQPEAVEAGRQVLNGNAKRIYRLL